MTKKTVRFAMAALLVVAGAITALAAGEDEEAMAATGSAPIIADNHGKNAWDLSEWQRVTGQTLTFTQAPILDAMDLPPVEQRLPDEPLVLLPTSRVKKIGTYQDLAWIRGNGPEALVSHSSRVMCRSAEYGGQVNQFLRTCQDMQSSNDGRTWTMTLRKGARFSDGSPMTTEDVAFFVEDVAQYEPFSTAIVGDSRRLLDAEFEVIDDYTFSLTFPQPNIALVGYLAEWYFVWFHKGYLSQFHPEYAGQDKVDALAKEAGFASAAEFFKDRVDEGQGFPRANPDLPTMAPWVLKVGAPATTYVFERNPYYLGIDAIGQQLPYFDEVRQDSTTDPTVLKLRALNGEYDWILFLGLDIFPAAKTAEANEQIIRARSWSDVHLVGGAQLIEFNQTTNDPDMRELASNRDFRCGVSHAINREAIATLIYYGAVPYGPLAYSERSPFYNERAATMCGDYDLDAANSLLDSAGLNERDDDGNRLWKGKPFEFTSTIRIQYNSATVADIVKQNLGDVGINMNIRSTDGWGGLQSVRNSGEMQAYIGPAWATYATDELATASFGAPFNDQGYFAPKWTQWVATDGAEGEEPPDVIKEGAALRRLLATQADMSDRIATVKQITDLHADNLWAIGIVGGVNTVITSYSLANVPEDDPENCWHCGDLGRPEVWFRDQ
ncbi:MAG: ABC transporter substrate-binding protein [Spirochaetaceae bacterium]|nr:ABC transporter substrate-binding protein [Spirochaetaceae bacterium]